MKKCSKVLLSISFGLWPILWKDKSICFSSVFLIPQSLHKIKVNMYSTSTYRIKKEDFFARLASFFWCWWTWKEVHQVMFWLLWWPRFDDHQHENCVTLICTSPNSFVMPYWTNRYELEKKMGDKFFRIIASPFACAKLVWCCILVIRQEIGVS